MKRSNIIFYSVCVVNCDRLISMHYEYGREYGSRIVFTTRHSYSLLYLYQCISMKFDGILRHCTKNALFIMLVCFQPYCKFGLDWRLNSMSKYVNSYQCPLLAIESLKGRGVVCNGYCDKITRKIYHCSSSVTSYHFRLTILCISFETSRYYVNGKTISSQFCLILLRIDMAFTIIFYQLNYLSIYLCDN